MRLSAAIPERDLTKRLDLVRELGFSGTDIWLDLDNSEPSAADIRNAFHTKGIALTQMSCYTNLECAPGDCREHQMQRLKAAIDLAAEAGARVIVSGCGHMDPDKPNDVFAAHPDNWTPAAMDRLVESCREAAAWAAAAGIVFCVESWVLLTLNSPRKLRELTDRVNNTAFGILFDPVNLMDLDVYFDNGAMIQEAFDLLGDNIKIVHAKDTLLVDSAFTYFMSEAVPGEGRLDYDVLLRCMESLSDETTPLHIEHLKTVDSVASARDFILDRARAAGVSIV